MKVPKYLFMQKKCFPPKFTFIDIICFLFDIIWFLFFHLEDLIKQESPVLLIFKFLNFKFKILKTEFEHIRYKPWYKRPWYKIDFLWSQIRACVNCNSTEPKLKTDAKLSFKSNIS